MKDEPARDADIIIIGAGPTGLVLANLLGGLGVSTLLIERNKTTVQEPRAVSIDDESLRTIQALGLLDKVMAQVVPGYGSRYLTPGGTCFLEVMPSGQPYGHPRRNAFRQPALEQELRDGIARYASVTSMFGHAVTRVAQTQDGVEVTRLREGRDEVFRARYLVGADGASSLVRKQLGIALDGETSPERWLIVDLENSPAERDTLVFCDPARPCIALPGPGMTRRFEFKLFPGEDEEQLLSESSVAGLLRSRGVAPESRIVRKTVYTFHARIAARWRDERIFLAGDAAHLTPPFAGQGMNSGLRDAHNLAWKLAAVVKDDLDPAILDSYELERRGHVAAMIGLALRMGRIMGPANRFSGWVTQTGFRLAGIWPALRSYFAEMKYKPKPRFRDGLLIPSANPLVGRLLPQPRVTDSLGASVLLDERLPAGFVVIAIDPRDRGAAARSACLLTDAGIPARPVTLLRHEASTVVPDVLVIAQTDDPFAQSTGSLLLVRPDRYVMAAFADVNMSSTLRVAVNLLKVKKAQLGSSRSE